jgi:hypothetical protein
MGCTHLFLYFTNQCGSKDGAQSSARMDNFFPRINLFEKEPMAQKMGPKVVLEWTTFPQRKIFLKKSFFWIIIKQMFLIGR